MSLVRTTEGSQSSLIGCFFVPHNRVKFSPTTSVKNLQKIPHNFPPQPVVGVSFRPPQLVALKKSPTTRQKSPPQLEEKKQPIDEL